MTLDPGSRQRTGIEPSGTAADNGDGTRRWMSGVKPCQCFQPLGDVAINNADALCPSPDCGLVTTDPAGQFTLAPAKDDEAAQQPMR